MRLLSLIPGPTDGTSFYRGVGPLSRLRDMDPSLQVMFVPQYDWSTMLMADALFMQRPFSAEHLKIAEIAKNCEKPLWIDYDDDLFSVPADNPTHNVYGKEETMKTVVKIISLADYISVSTQAIADRIGEIEKTAKRKFNVKVIPNSVDFRLMERKMRPLAKNRSKQVFWRGSNTHQRDLLQVAYEVIELAKQKPDWAFHFMGYHPFFLTEQMGPTQGIHSEALDLMVYANFLMELQPPIFFFPLAETRFNLCKSNCSWLELTLAGAMTIAPDFPEFRRPGIINYKGSQQFQDMLKAAMQGEFDVNKKVSESLQDIRENYDLSKNNLKRMDILNELAHRAYSAKS